LGEWGNTYNLFTSTEIIPSAPVTTITGGAGIITVELPNFPQDALRVDIRISNGIFGIGDTVTGSFTSSGIRTIAAPGSASPGLAYMVSLITVTPAKINGIASIPVLVYVTDPAASIIVEPSVAPSVPTASSTLGAIQISWDGKTSSGSDQPLGFNAAKVYVGTTGGFTPSTLNQVDVLDFANGQNTLNIAVGTVVNGVALTYSTDYYIKIATTNGTDVSSPVSATGNPVRIGQVGNGDIVEITADKIRTGTISSQTVTVGAPGGKRVELRGTGNPIEIFGTGGTSLFSYDATSSKLTIKGDGEFSGNISGANGEFTGSIVTNGAISAANGLFTVNNGYMEAKSASIGGWSVVASKISSPGAGNRIELNPITPEISLIKTATDGFGGPGTISISVVRGIVGPDNNVNGVIAPSFQLNPNGNASFRGTIDATGGTFSGNIQANGTITGGTIIGSTFISSGAAQFPQGDLTINGGYISHTTGIFLDSPGLFAQSTSGYLYLMPDASVIMGKGNAQGDLQLRIVQNNLSFEGLNKGYYLFSLNEHIGTAVNGTSNRSSTVTVQASGRLKAGRAFFNGSAASAAAVQTDVDTLGVNGGKLGDIYFSTA